MLTVYYHPGYEAPIGEHIMPMRKFSLVADGLRDSPDIKVSRPEPVSDEELRRVHTPEYLEAVRTGEPRDLAQSQKFPWSPELFPSVCLTAGGCLAAARQALKDGAAAALASGFHHACSDHGEGFCTFNGLVVTIDALIAAGEIRRAAVLDLDLHYGNGTAQLAERRPYLSALSLYGNDYWDNFYYRDVTQRHHHDGENHVSFALPAGCDRPELLEIMEAALPWLAERRPDLVLYQAGADPYFEDPYSPLALDHEDLLERDRRVFEFTKAHGLPVAWVLAGGYTSDVSKVVRVHLNTFTAWREVYGR
jgi:acetoin utilization deacetylase AcuC-like enzyme